MAAGGADRPRGVLAGALGAWAGEARTGGGSAKAAGGGARTGEEFSLLPPEWGNRVVFYQNFNDKDLKPAINTAKLKVSHGKLPTSDDGLTGRTWSPHKDKGQARYELQGDLFGGARPYTVMFWWRPTKEMKLESGVNFLTVSGDNGRYILNRISGKQEWCQLPSPTITTQLQNCPGITNINDVGTRIWYDEPGRWHHVAMTVYGGSDIKVYYDGAVKNIVTATGRQFKSGEFNRIAIGSIDGDWPADFDEIILLDRALTDTEIAAYYKSISGTFATGMFRKNGDGK